MKNIVRLFQELQDYSNSDSVGISLTDSSMVFIFIFESLGVFSKVTISLEELRKSSKTDDEIETELLEEVHRGVSKFKSDNGILD